MSKLIGEVFWTDRWRRSHASLLPMEMRGFYREMLTAAWTFGASLPNSDDAIKRAIRCTDEEFARCWPTIRRYWRATDDGLFLVNDTQLAVYAETKARLDRGADQRRNAARARWARVKGPKLVR